MSSPNPLRVLLSMLRARRKRHPNPTGRGVVDHSGLATILNAVASRGMPALADHRDSLAAYLNHLAAVDPNELSRDEALSFWINLYNAGALDLARRAYDEARGSVLRLPGGFTGHFVDIAREGLSLDDVEHGKIRRFGDPRIHAALVCGSVSCPTLRFEPFEGRRLHAQLDDQMRSFLASGAAVPDIAGGLVSVSRVFRWYGADFARPHRMPTLLPARPRAVLSAVTQWLDPDVAAWVAEADPKVAFQKYDWALGCAVRRP